MGFQEIRENSTPLFIKERVHLLTRKNNIWIPVKPHKASFYVNMFFR